MTSLEFKALVKHWAAVMSENKDYLIELDGVVGDSDLGLTMSDGFLAAANAIADSEESDIGKLSYFAGKAMSTATPSTMGTLMASGFMQAGKVMKGATELDAAKTAEFFGAFLDGVKLRGKAEVGEKTFVDGFQPAVQVLVKGAEESESMQETADKTSKTAHEAFLATRGMLAKHGRAAGRGEQSRDLLDPGAAVADLMFKGYAEFLNNVSA